MSEHESDQIEENKQVTSAGTDTPRMKGLFWKNDFSAYCAQQQNSGRTLATASEWRRCVSWSELTWFLLNSFSCFSIWSRLPGARSLPASTSGWCLCVCVRKRGHGESPTPSDWCSSRDGDSFPVARYAGAHSLLQEHIPASICSLSNTSSSTHQCKHAVWPLSLSGLQHGTKTRWPTRTWTLLHRGIVFSPGNREFTFRWTAAINTWITPDQQVDTDTPWYY